ncbi:MAG: hypothetical protein A2017_18700 [Lentisphaerae bacterium GWF2_44_16]|nr:MAG: hypothetical protein A2017_18700 [Lentisphaerae bacterium GWF2_44_16]
MELTDLKYFAAVAEELNFRRAARKLNMAQPPLSRRIKNLEDEIGTPLFIRTNRSVRLTEAGKLFFEKANEIIEKAGEALEELSLIGKGEEGYLPIGFNEPAINTFLSKAIKRYHSRYPKVKLVLKEMQTNEQLEALKNNKIKIGFMRLFGHDVSGMSTSLLYSERYILAIPKNHALGKYRKITLEMLKQEPMIIFPRKMNPGLYDHFMAKFEDAGFKPMLEQEASTKHTTLALVEAGLGIALVPESSISMSKKGVEFHNLEASLPSIEIYAVWQKNESSSVLMNFIKILSPPART